MTLSVEVKKRRGRPRWEVAVTDPEREAFRGYFEFELGDELRHISTRIEISHPASVLPATVLRDFPVRRWTRAARAAITERVVQLAGTASTASAASGELSIHRDAIVSPAPVALLVNLPKTSARTEKAEERLRQVAEEYRANVRNGLRDPVGAIARAHDVANVTARSWVHRARQKGFLGPAVGPTPGEGV